MIVYQPDPGPQTRACEWDGRYLLYGGSKNTGKSEWLLADPFYQIYIEEERVGKGEIPSSTGRAGFFRRNYDQLREVITRSKRKFPLIFPKTEWSPGCTWNGQTRTWTLPSGYQYVFGNMDEDGDWIKYYGMEFTWLGWDELPTFTEEQFDQMDTCLRSTDPVLKKMLYNRAGANPVGVGVKWVRKRFVECAPPNTPVIKRIPVEVVENGVKVRKVVEHRQIFIPAKVSDNTHADQAEYTAMLSTKSPAMVRALRDGDWYVSDGAFLSALWDTAIHVCKPFKIPKGWFRFRSCRYGYEQPATVSWWACDPDGNLVCYRNLTLLRHDAEMLAYRVREVEQELDLWDAKRGCSKLRGPLGPETAWGHEKHSGPTVAETMFRVGVYWARADKDRTGADDQLRWRLARRTADPNKRGKDNKPLLRIPGIRWFKGCTDPIETIPTLPPDEKNVELPSEKGDFWHLHEAGFACLSRPVVPDREQENDDAFERELEREFPKPATTARRTSYLW